MKVVILHGWGHSSADWTQISQLLKTQFDLEVIALDLPGFGRQPIAKEILSVPDYADWVRQQLNSLNSEVVILGHSFGGRIASYLASSNPGWLKGLILYAAPCIYRPSIKTRAKVWRYKVLKRLVPARFRSNFYSDDLKRAEQTGLSKIFREVVTFDQTEQLKLINVKTLVIWGEQDESVPLRIGREVSQLIRHSDLTILPGVGHNAHLQNPLLFYGTITRFIQSL